MPFTTKQSDAVRRSFTHSTNEADKVPVKDIIGVALSADPTKIQKNTYAECIKALFPKVEMRKASAGMVAHHVTRSGAYVEPTVVPDVDWDHFDSKPEIDSGIRPTLRRINLGDPLDFDETMTACSAQTTGTAFNTRLKVRSAKVTTSDESVQELNGMVVELADELREMKIVMGKYKKAFCDIVERLTGMEREHHQLVKSSMEFRADVIDVFKLAGIEIDDVKDQQ